MWHECYSWYRRGWVVINVFPNVKIPGSVPLHGSVRKYLLWQTQSDRLPVSRFWRTKPKRIPSILFHIVFISVLRLTLLTSSVIETDRRRLKTIKKLYCATQWDWKWNHAAKKPSNMPHNHSSAYRFISNYMFSEANTLEILTKLIRLVGTKFGTDWYLT